MDSLFCNKKQNISRKKVPDKQESMAEGKHGHGSGDVPVFEHAAQRAAHALSSALFNACQSARSPNINACWIPPNGSSNMKMLNTGFQLQGPDLSPN